MRRLIALLLLAGCNDASLTYTSVSDDKDDDGYRDGVDCDDDDPNTHPGAEEIWYDGIDQDCDGNDCDADGDGFDAAEGCGGTDCDDTAPRISPDAEETWYDGVDQDCDGWSDYDADFDGYDSDSYGGEDCDDTNPDRSPDAEETWYDGTDQDCDDNDCDADGDGFDSAEHCGGEDCDDADAEVSPAATEIWYDGTDQDCDGWSDYDADFDGFDSMAESDSGDDCDDADDQIHPGAEDIEDNGVDEDCDGTDSSSGTTDFDLAGSDALIYGADSGDNAGRQVDLDVDLDGDGLDDLLIGADGASFTSAQQGAAYVVYGSATGNVDLATDADGAWYGTGSVDEAGGYGLAGVDDVDGDGMDELFVGAWKNDDGGSDAGAAYLVFGPASGDHSLDEADATFIGESSSDYAGRAITGPGDLDGDGWGDLAIGARQNNSSRGAVYLLMGPHSGTTDLSQADVKWTGESASDNAGGNLSALGDVSGDGVPDLGLSAVEDDDGGTDAGAVYVLFGPATTGGSLAGADIKLLGDSAGDRVSHVLGAGDINGDGHADLLTSCAYDDDGGTDAGAVWLVHGPLTSGGSLAGATAKILGLPGDNNTLNGSSGSASGIGDLDGDGNDEIVFGSRLNDEAATDAGAAYLFMGPVSGTLDTTAATVRFLGVGAGDGAGISVAGGGDVDGDGLPDLAFGAWKEDTGGSDAGAVYLVLGSTLGL